MRLLIGGQPAGAIPILILFMQITIIRRKQSWTIKHQEMKALAFLMMRIMPGYLNAAGPTIGA
ncbi:hypothetical protein A2160_03280 [Candidatus Beckwithbacteria bacterium RBG_13_42_9]|uniref:Uncharacterized protein n=1 Tax=Candidatus Beckwithbacteria bacterium RBG_13_42_9 TaxID=1797457 RepID=A0A1F5E9P4_9BACT|nr:MAG: hypothetical protein A2160_03280 [Candidatus Beckwithbacteria bacterium RBG_13_42_9]